MNHAAWIELDARAFDHNVQQFRSFLQPNTLFSAVLKSNAYGHGLIQMGLLCQAHPEVDYVCVFFLSEALELRKNGFTKPILVLGSLDGDLGEAIDADVEVVCYDQAQLAEFHKATKKKNKSIKIHIKVDTGLSRLGFFPEQVLDIFNELTNYPLIEVMGMMTHFSESGALDTEWTQRQERIFLETVEELRKKNKLPRLLHASNTGATLRFPDSHLSMVRIGGGLYGLPQRTYVYDLIKEKNPDFSMKPVLSLKSRIMTIKKLPAGSFVSYDRLYQASTPKRIAIIPVGYNDGYGRRKPAGLHVLINGSLAPILGSVCMNLVIVDISHLWNVQVGDEVTLIGDHEGIRVNDISPLIGCVNYEVTTCLDRTMIRKIMHQDDIVTAQFPVHQQDLQETL